MVVLIANMEWNDYGWTRPQIPDNPTFGYTKEGHMPHETLNFMFDKPVDNDNIVHGFFQSRWPLKNLAKNNEDTNLVFFYSRHNIVGVYGNAKFLERRIQLNNPVFENEKQELNVTGQRDLSLGFVKEAYLETKPEHIKNKQIGQSIYVYIDPKNAKNVLFDVIKKYEKIIKSKKESKEEKLHLAKLRRLIKLFSDESETSLIKHDYFSKLLSQKKQVIFYGPPGTGKTFGAQKCAVNFLTKQVMKKINGE